MTMRDAAFPICGKRRYESKRAARSANRSARFRLFIYFCELCHGFHVANAEKR